MLVNHGKPADRNSSAIKIGLAPDSKYLGGHAKPHILTYDPGRIKTITALWDNRDITVCSGSISSSMLGHLAYVVYALTVMLILGFTAFPDGERGESGPACAPGPPPKNIKMCQLNELLQDTKGEFRFLIAFMLAGYVAMTIKVWATRRQNYAALCGNARNLSIQIASTLPIDGSPSMVQRRELLARWVMLAFELAMLKAKGKMDADKSREFLLGSDLLQPGEWEAMVPGDRHSTVFFWISTELVRLQRAGVIEPEATAGLNGYVSSMRGQANDLMSSLDRDKPYSYASLCGLLVQINIVIMSSWKGVEWAIWLHSFGGRLTEQPKFWVDIVALFAWNTSYKALYDLSYQLHNPFGDRQLDVAHEVIGSGIRQLAAQIASVQGRLPPALMGAAVSSSGTGKNMNASV